ncbi:MAG: hypothetical protein IT435_12190 [Phycisphaerales bacterium]|nr:hypothetical protein [Phycisphaerales bacterium]
MNTQAHARSRFGWCAAITSAGIATSAWVAPASAQPYASSVVGTEFDFIIESDPSLFEKLDCVGEQVREMADSARILPN